MLHVRRSLSDLGNATAEVVEEHEEYGAPKSEQLHLGRDPGGEERILHDRKEHSQRDQRCDRDIWRDDVYAWSTRGKTTQHDDGEQSYGYSLLPRCHDHRRLHASVQNAKEEGDCHGMEWQHPKQQRYG